MSDRSASRVFGLININFAADVRNFLREGLLAFLLSLPVVIALVYRFLLPALENQLQERLGFDLEPYHPMLMAGFTGMCPALIGGVYGLLLVDERDQRTLPVLRVMPMPFSTYLAARLTVPCFLSVLVTIAAYPLAGLTPLPAGSVALLAISAATILPVGALFVVMAPNKLTGLVLFRLITTFSVVPIFAYIAPGDWERAVWVIPSYWPMKALWLAAEGAPYRLELFIAPVMNAALSFWLYRHFTNASE